MASRAYELKKRREDERTKFVHTSAIQDFISQKVSVTPQSRRAGTPRSHILDLTLRELLSQDSRVPSRSDSEH